MSLTLHFSPAFKRSLKLLGAEQLKILGSILEALEAYYRSGCDLERAKSISSGFFYKQLRKPYYEAGIESNIRVVLIREQNKCIALLAGNHNQIKTFLRNI